MSVSFASVFDSLAAYKIFFHSQPFSHAVRAKVYVAFFRTPFFQSIYLNPVAKIFAFFNFSLRLLAQVTFLTIAQQLA